MEASAHLIEMMRTRVVIADPNEVYRAGVKSILANAEWATVVGETSNEEELLDLLRTATPDLVIMDPGIAIDADVDIIGRVRSLLPSVRVVVVTPTPQVTTRAIIQSGADGCLLKAAAPEELAAALRLVADGRSYIQADLVGRLLSGTSTDRGSSRLSARDLDILRLVAGGHKNKQVAREFGMSLTSLKSQLRLIYAQLDVSNRVEAVAAAVRLGIVN